MAAQRSPDGNWLCAAALSQLVWKAPLAPPLKMTGSGTQPCTLSIMHAQRCAVPIVVAVWCSCRHTTVLFVSQGLAHTAAVLRPVYVAMPAV